jgi:hypothetical protein
VNEEEQSIASMLPPANPIISKSLDKSGERVSFRLDPLKQLTEERVRISRPKVQKC